MSTSCVPPLPLTKCIIALFQKPKFSYNSKKYKTKTIPKNSIFFKPKYDLRKRNAIYDAYYDKTPQNFA